MIIGADRLKRIFSTMIIYYFIIGLIIFLSVDVARVKVNRLNCLEDFASYPVKYLEHKVPFQERQFRYARKYYRTLIDLIPRYEKIGRINGPVTLSRTYAMIALCDYYLGKNKEAIGLFKKALKIEPRHFWFNYNLGVIYFQSGDYETALSYLKDFLSVDKEKLDDSMGLDDFDLWEPALAEKYKQVSLAQFHEVTFNSYKLAILAYERLKNPGLTSQRAAVGSELFDLMVNPSLYFVPIGQEKYLARRR